VTRLLGRAAAVVAAALIVSAAGGVASAATMHPDGSLAASARPDSDFLVHDGVIPDQPAIGSGARPAVLSTY
jgi:hypothetical protein